MTNRRDSINEQIAAKKDVISKMKSEIIALEREAFLLCDEHQRFEENEEDIIISRRPRKVKKALVGRIYWREKFKDEYTGRGVWINRTRIVRLNGEWI